MPVHQILVVSHLPGHVAPTGLRLSMRAARERAASCGLGGGLLFDGERFLHLFVGPAGAAQRALALLQGDAAHEGLTPVHATASEPAPAWEDWQVGYTEPAVLDAVMAASNRGLALQAFALAMSGAALT
jgi:hypothetical protein